MELGESLERQNKQHYKYDVYFCIHFRIIAKIVAREEACIHRI